MTRIMKSFHFGWSTMWSRIDEVVWAIEGHPDSPGMQLAAEYKVELAPPPPAENTPETFDKFMRDEVARQGEMAEQSGQKLKPQK